PCPTPLLFHLTHFFCTATAPPEIYTLSLHDALPISLPSAQSGLQSAILSIRATGSGPVIADCYRASSYCFNHFLFLEFQYKTVFCVNLHRCATDHFCRTAFKI